MIDKILQICGVPYSLAGYKVLRRLVELRLEADTSLKPQKRLYDVVAAEAQLSPSSVEKNARTALTAAWRRKPDKINALMCRDEFTAPPVMDFVGEVSRYILQQQQHPK